MSCRFLAPGVAVVSDFLPLETAARIVKLVEPMAWTPAFVGYYRDDALVDKRLNLEERDVEVLKLSTPFDEVVPGFSERVSTLVAEAYGLPGLNVDGFVISRYTPGSHIQPHSDTGVRSTSRLVTCVQYLNEDYGGGAVLFPQFDISLRPRTGDLVLFFSEYLHAVAQITEGVRYSIVSFARAPAVLKLPRWA